MSERCARCGDGTIGDDGLPDIGCWDHRASADDVHAWVARLRQEPHDRARQYLSEIGDPGAADALRSYLETDDPLIVSCVLRSLGWSGDETDAPALAKLASHPDRNVRMRACEAMTDLGIPGAADLLWAAFNDFPSDSHEAKRMLEGLVWLRDKRALPIIREMYAKFGLEPRAAGFPIADMLARLGDARDRTLMAEAATASLEAEAANGYQRRRYERSAQWNAYVHAVGRVAPEEVDAARDALSPAAAKALTWYPFEPAETPTAEEAALRPLVVPRRAIVDYREAPIDVSDPTPAKFCGQPDWRDTPAWPIGGDGQLLLFYGQLPIGPNGEPTAYLFTGGPEEWDALGPGSAVVIQPGNTCHLPTVNVARGPQSYAAVVEGDRFVPRLRSLPRPEKFVVFEDGFDPETWAPDGSDSQGNSVWNKIGGTPVWLQGDEPPTGGDWAYAFQFDADGSGGERGDGAIFYGWMNSAGAGALGWQCH